jgi:N-acetylneuraminic acid mutarotase
MRIKWSEGRWFPILIKGGAMGIVDDMPVYAAGVSYPWRESEMSWFFDPDRRDWTPAKPMPVGRCYTSGTTAGDGLLVIGGRKSTSEGPVSLNDAWLLRHIDGKWKWTELPPLNKGRADGAVSVLGDLAICAGGGEWERTRGGAFTACNITNAEVMDMGDPDRGWIDIGNIPFPPRVGCSGAAVGKSFYLLGGYNCWVGSQKVRHFQYFDQVLRCDCSAILPQHSGERPQEDMKIWNEVSPLPVKLSGHQSVVYNDRYIISMGGVARLPFRRQEIVYQKVKVDSKRGVLQGEYSDLVWVYDTRTDTHELLEERMPHGLNDLRACIKGSRIYVVGGENCDVTTSNTTNFLMIGDIEE